MLRTSVFSTVALLVGCTGASKHSGIGESSETTELDSSTTGDVSTSEADTHVAGTSDSADPPDAERHRFCDGHLDAVLCSDFGPPEGLFGWALWVTERGAGVLLQSDETHSRPTSVESRIEDAEELRVARVFHSIQVDATSLHVSFAVRVAGECFDAGTPVEIAEVGITPTTEPAALRFILEPEVLAIAGPFTNGAITSGAPFVSELWHEVELELDAVDATISITIDDTVIADRLPAPLPAEMERLQLHFGARRQAYEAGECTLFVDDVVVTI